MTAGIQSGQGVSAAASGENFSVTVGNSGTVFGFVSGSIGSISPGTFKGETIDAASSDTSAPAYDFSFSLNNGALAQTFFRAVLVQRTDGAWTRYETAAASFSVGTGTWTWGTGSNPAFTSTGTRAIILYR